MRSNTLLVCSVELEEVRIGCTWDGGPRVAVHVEQAGSLRRVGSWDVWNDAWGSPLIEATRESFERFVRMRLAEPGLVDQLVGIAAA